MIMALVALLSLCGPTMAAEPITPELIGWAANQEDLKGVNPLGPMIVAFGMDDCAPCKLNRPYVEAFAQAHGWAFVYIDANPWPLTEAELSASVSFLQKYEIYGLPTYFVCNAGLLVDRVKFGGIKLDETPVERSARINKRFEESAVKMAN